MAGSRESPVDKLGERLKKLRELANQTQDEVAKAVDVNTGTYSRWERGVGKPHAAEIVALAQHFNVATDHLLLGEKPANAAVPRELHRFLNTKLGEWADAHGYVPMLKALQFDFPPTVETYKNVIITYRLVNRMVDDDDDDGDDQKKPKK